MTPNTTCAKPKPKTVFAIILFDPRFCFKAYPVAVTADPNAVGISPSRIFKVNPPTSKLVGVNHLSYCHQHPFIYPTRWSTSN
jgi:hypothetical protein